jgi:cation diffusion facilitator CzcD-associated flavoprotein CzcO
MNRPDIPRAAEPASLAELEARFRRDLELLLVPPAKSWLEPRTHPRFGPVLDVAIVGAGMAGLAAALAFKCLGIRNLKIFDRSPAGFEGPWASYARMEVLRSPKELTGPALGFANLTFRAWFEAQFGRAAWDDLHRIPRLQWMDYLRWFRRMVDAPIENNTALIDLGGDAETVLLKLKAGGRERQVAARRLVLANGRDGLGGPYVPALLKALDRHFWAHSGEPIDFTRLKGKTVAVIGAGASAVDNAAEALEAGAARVAMLVRRAEVPRINKGMGIGSAGMAHGFARLQPAQQWAIVQYIADSAIPAPRDSMLRCSRHKNFSLIIRCEPHAVAIRDGRVLLDTTRGKLAFDYLILCTGFATDWSQRPELAALAPHVMRWGDRFIPDGRDRYDQADEPFLGPDLEFLERDPGTAPWVSRVHCFTFPAYLNHGAITGDIPFISVGAERVANGVAALLFAEDFSQTWKRMLAWDSPELLGDEFVVDGDVEKFAAPSDSLATSGADNER